MRYGRIKSDALPPSRVCNFLVLWEKTIKLTVQTIALDFFKKTPGEGARDVHLGNNDVQVQFLYILCHIDGFDS